MLHLTRGDPRAHGHEALARWVEGRNALFPHDYPDSVQVLALARARELGHVNLLALVDDEPVGVAMLSDDPGTQAAAHAYADWQVYELGAEELDVELSLVAEQDGKVCG